MNNSDPNVIALVKNKKKWVRERQKKIQHQRSYFYGMTLTQNFKKINMWKYLMFSHCFFSFHHLYSLSNPFSLDYIAAEWSREKKRIHQHQHTLKGTNKFLLLMKRKIFHKNWGDKCYHAFFIISSENFVSVAQIESRAINHLKIFRRRRKKTLNKSLIFVVYNFVGCTCERVSNRLWTILFKCILSLNNHKYTFCRIHVHTELHRLAFIILFSFISLGWWEMYQTFTNRV